MRFKEREENFQNLTGKLKNLHFLETAHETASQAAQSHFRSFDAACSPPLLLYTYNWRELGMRCIYIRITHTSGTK